MYALNAYIEYRDIAGCFAPGDKHKIHSPVSKRNDSRMNKHDLILAKKALAARQVKTEHKVSLRNFLHRKTRLTIPTCCVIDLQYIETIMKQRSLNASKSESTLRNSVDLGKSTSSLSNSAILGKSTSTLQLPDIHATTSAGSPVPSKKSSKANSPKVVLIICCC